MAEDKAKKLLLIVNPVSGKKMAKRYMMKMINRFDEAGYSVTACCTQKNKNAYDITLSRGAGFDLIVCVGGDGTLKETVAGVMKLGKDIPLGFIPLGSTNDFAKSLGIPIDVSDAVDAIINGTPMPVDMGVFGKDSFICRGLRQLYRNIVFGQPKGQKCSRQKRLLFAGRGRILQNEAFSRQGYSRRRGF